MSKLTIKFNSMNELRDQLIAISTLYFGVDASEASSTEPAPALALYTSEELQGELHRRQTSSAPEPATTPTTPEKRKPGRPKKNSAPTPTSASTYKQVELPIRDEAPPLNEAAKPLPPQEPALSGETVAPHLPTEDQVLGLMSEVYSSSGDMELVRAIMSDVGGKTQLSQIPPRLWPELMKRLTKEQVRLNGKGAAA
jgi:hypothetical protein